LEDEVLQVKLKQFCEKKQKHADARLSVRMFFVKERRFGESIYEETGVAVACLREFPLTSFPVTIGYFF